MKSEPTTKAPMASMLKLERILVPMDFSSASQKALDYAVMLASNFEAKITLLHVIELISGPKDPIFGCVPVDNGPRAEASARRLEKLAVEMVPATLLEATLVRHGIPYHEITIAAKELRMDLIVTTTHGCTGLTHVLLGSTAERIVRHSPCPVLSVRVG